MVFEKGTFIAFPLVTQVTWNTGRTNDSMAVRHLNERRNIQQYNMLDSNPGLQM